MTVYVYPNQIEWMNTFIIIEICTHIGKMRCVFVLYCRFKLTLNIMNITKRLIFVVIKLSMSIGGVNKHQVIKL